MFNLSACRGKPRLLLLAALWSSRVAFSQELEPRRWTHLPTGTHVAGVGYAYTRADISFSPVLRIENARTHQNTLAAKYIQTFEMLGRSARIDVAGGYVSGNWKGLVNGESRSIERDGAADSMIRLSMALYGAPPLEGKAFANYRAKKETETIVGAGLAFHLPTGEYFSDRLINLGHNRYTIRPQLGVVHTRGKVSAELTGAIWVYTDNNDFYGDTRLEKDPLYVLQSHLNYTFRPGLWVNGGLAFGYGAESTLNGIKKDDRSENLLWTLELGCPINRRAGVKLAYIGTQSQTSLGADSHSVVTALSVLW